VDQLVEATPLTNITILWMNHLTLSILTYDRATIHFIILIEHTIIIFAICYIIKLIKEGLIEAYTIKLARDQIRKVNERRTT
jgi:hypothetical protein